jgi:hypothetical protein
MVTHAARQSTANTQDAMETLAGESMADVAARVGDLRLAMVLGRLNPSVPRFGVLPAGTVLVLPSDEDRRNTATAPRPMRPALPRLQRPVAMVAPTTSAELHGRAMARIRAAQDAVRASCQPVGLLALVSTAAHQPLAMHKHMAAFGVSAAAVRALHDVSVEAMKIIDAAREVVGSAVPLTTLRHHCDARVLLVAERMQAQLPVLDAAVQQSLGVQVALAAVVTQLHAFAVALGQAGQACQQLPQLARAFATQAPQLAGPALARFVDACMAADVPAALRDHGVVAMLCAPLQAVTHNAAALHAHLSSRMVVAARHAGQQQQLAGRLGDAAVKLFNEMVPTCAWQGNHCLTPHQRGLVFVNVMQALGHEGLLAGVVDDVIAAAVRIGMTKNLSRSQSEAIHRLAASLRGHHIDRRPLSVLACAVLAVSLLTDVDLARTQLDGNAWTSMAQRHVSAILASARLSFEQQRPARHAAMTHTTHACA